MQSLIFLSDYLDLYKIVTHFVSTPGLLYDTKFILFRRLIKKIEVV